MRATARLAISLLGLAAGCDDAASPTPLAPTVIPGQVTSVLLGTASSAHASSSALALVPKALDETLARVPAELPPTSPSGSLVGTEASAAASASSASSVAPPEPSALSHVELRQDLKASSAGSERDLRAALYFQLVDRCRQRAGTHLPPEAVEIEFRVDPRGRIDRTSVLAKPSKPEFAGAAECMARVVRTADARFAPPRLDEPTKVRARVPSVD